MLLLQGFTLKSLKHLVLDEADKLLDMDFEQELDQILKVCQHHQPGKQRKQQQQHSISNGTSTAAIAQQQLLSRSGNAEALALAAFCYTSLSSHG